MEPIIIINNSTDQNNSQVVIFQPGVGESELTATASHVLSIAKGETVSVPVAEDKVFVAVSAVEGLKGQLVNAATFLTPVVTVLAGQTVVISGDAVRGYGIKVENV